MTSNEIIDKLESLNLKDVPQRIVIEPVEIDHNRNYRTSVVLSARNGEDIRPKLGIYSIEGQYLRPTQVNKWVIVFLFDKQAVDGLAQGKYTFDSIKNFADCYIDFGRSKGISITPLASIQCIPAQATNAKNVDTMPSQDLKDELRLLFIKLNNNLVNHAIIILPDNVPSWIHGYLQYLETCKWDREVVGGDSSTTPVDDKLMKTSRIRLKTLVDLAINSSCGGKRSLIPKIWLKYNTKLGGLNVALKRTFDTHDMKFLNDGHLIISIDLNQHDAQRSDSPLISVVVGMWDLASPEMSFHTQTRVQAKSADDRVDLMAVKDLEQMIADIINAYKRRKDNQIPTRVIVFRAGGYKRADNEFTIEEIVSIKSALNDAHALQEALGSGEQVKVPVLTYLKVPKKRVIRKHQDAARLAAHPHASTRVVHTGSLVNSIITSQADVPEVKSKGFPPVMKPEFPPVVKRETTTGPSTFNRPKSNIYKLYDEAKMSTGAIQAMVHALSFLSPRVTAMTRPTPIDLADLAGERTNNIVMAWMDENKIQPEDPQFLSKVNRFLASEMADSTYKDHLYYA